MRKIYLIFTLFIAACATTETTGFVDPDYSAGKYQINKVVVRVGAPLEYRDKTETALVEKFNSMGVEAERYLDVAPPTREYSYKQSLNLVKKTGANAYYVVLIDDVSLIDTFIPPTYHPGSSTSTVNVIGNTAYVNTQTSPGYTSGGYTVSKPVMSSVLYLIDPKNAQVAWQAESFSSGAGVSTYNDLLMSSGKSGITDLFDKGLIIETTPSEE